jgi:signal transduction histidine kinase/DNA-binding response OmpR family regulator
LRTVPVLLLSARAGEEARVEGWEAGADDYLVKPFSAKELVARVGTHLEMARIRRDAEQAVRESEERFRAFTNATSDVVYSMSADWSEMRYLQGRAFVADTLAPSRTWPEQYIHPDDRPQVQAAIERAIQTKSIFELEHRVIRVDGTLGWAQSRAIPILDRDGDVVEWFGTATDVTRQKDDEELLKADLAAMTRLQRLGTLFVSQGNLEPVLGEIVDAAIAIADADCGNIQLIDPTTGNLRIVAHRGFEKWWLDYWDTVSHGRGACDAALARAERVVVEDVTASPIFAGTPALDIQLRAGIRAVQSTPLVSRSGRPIGVFSTHYRTPHRPNERALRLLDLLARQAADIVERAQIEAAVRESEERLREADRRKDEFLATLAHELRNPLAPIRTGLELIRLGGSSVGSIERVRGIMERQIGHMVRLIDDLLDISRITSGKIRLQRQPAVLSELVEGAVEATRAFIAERRVKLAVHLPDTPCVLDVDRTRFVQILSNLLHNAAKFTEPDGRIDVTAEISASDASDRRELAITVADSGIGISQEMLPRVFDLFTQGDGAAGQAQGGLGIGLALVRRLVEMHGGGVEARSEGRGRGTQVTVRVPVAETAPAGGLPSVPGETSAVTGRVLIVDDNQDAAHTLAMLVDDLGGESQIANDGPSALRRMAEFRPDVVLLDIGMPGLDGYETCRRIRQTPGGSDLIVVALTGWGQDDDKQRAVDAGFDRHLTKPADPVAVQKLLAEVGNARERARGARSA